jgi:uncharacterized membrane protein YbhN (UPF0104 family)
MSALAVLSFSKRLTAPFRPIIQRWIPRKLVTVIERLRQGIYLYRNRPGALLLLFIVTCITQVNLILLGCVTLYGIAGNFFLSEYFAFLPIIEIIANAGPTPNGIGVREALTVAFFTYLKIPNEQLGIYVFITVSFATIVRLTGGIPVLHGMLKERNKRQLS